MKPISIQTILNRVATKSDGSLSLSFTTPEMNAEETTVLIKLARINLTMLLQPLGERLEAPLECKGELQTKTQAQRIRAVLFCYWSHMHETGRSGGKSFEQFYNEQTERWIEEIKALLPAQ